MNTSATALLLMLGPALGSGTAPVKAADPDRKEWVSLFDGKSLAGWVPKITGYDVGVNFADTFRVEDGVLKVRYDKYDTFGGRFGHLFYQTPFSHYVIAVEYRFVGEQAKDGPGWAFRNSGVMIHGQPVETMKKDQDFPISIEAQLLGGRGDGTARSTANLCTPGTNVVMNGQLETRHCINSSSKTFDGDQWVRVEIEVHGGGEIVHKANGETVLRYEKPQIGGGNVAGHDPAAKRDGEILTSGSISLQAESHPVEFRKVELLNLVGCRDRKARNYKAYFEKDDAASCRYESSPPATTGPKPPVVDFARDVQPILATSCVRCHTAELHEGALRLDTHAGLLKGGEAGPPLVPGDGRASLLYRRLVAVDPEERMPQRSPPLSPAQIETLRRWIDQGASWPEGMVVADAYPGRPRPPTTQSRARRTDGPLVSFNKDVRPILAGNCYGCHGPDRNRRQMGLRLDLEEAATAPLPSGQVAIVPGHPERSALLQRVTDPDEQKRMPHVSSGKPRLSATTIETLRRWIAQGAQWEPHWSYVRPTRPSPPAVKDADWVRGPVDAFVLAGIEKEGLAPSPEAERRELLRRVSFDLVGLPPTPEEVRAFVGDASPGAYERQVDRLLASPRFGERMAVHWLDLVRYADSVGYHSDNARTVWPYRDYVIGAFNRNLPFDQFTAVQLAGDLLPDASPEQRIASGYNRLLQTTEEGGAQPKEYRAIYLADRVRNASAVWLGATVGCAQCHDHKFDPYRARDFYSLAAFFADVKEKPVGRRDPDYLPTDSQRPSLESLERDIERLRKQLDESTPALEASQRRWEQTLAGARAYKWTALEPVEASSARGTRVLIQGNDFSVIATTASGPKPARDTYTVRLKTALQGMTAFRLDALTFDELPRGGPGRDPQGGFVVSEMVIMDGAGRAVPLRHATASTPPPVSGTALGPNAAIDGRIAAGGWALGAADRLDHRLVAETVEPVGRGDDTTLTLVLHQNAGHGRTLGRFRLSGTTDARPVVTEPGPAITKEIVELAVKDPARRTPEEQETLTKLHRRVAPELASVRDALRAAELRKADLVPDVLQSLVTNAQTPDPVRILPRGNWLDESGEVVEPAVPHFLPQIETHGRRATRLDLARWLTSPENPLTARVFVNRQWKLFFGQGLSRTLEDLGSQGEWPTHPELLDWLAVEFLESGWDVKRLVKTLVTSATYRQTSRASSQVLGRDPDNRLYARQARFRLDAEMVRDNVLAVTGLLSTKMGGPSVRPYQPRGYWAYLNFPPREWDDSTGEDQHRRAIYTWWQRTFPQPSLAAFDAPSREECVAERTRANVPQQALALLNDPTYVEAARVFAERIVREGGTGFEDRLRWAYARALGRAPRDEEARILGTLLNEHRAQYRADPRAAGRLVRAGLAPAPAGLDLVELAAWTSVARAILNLPEVITRS